MESERTNRKQPEIYEKDLKFKVDFELPLANGIYGNSLKFGAKYASKTKTAMYCYDYAEPQGCIQNSVYGQPHQ